MTFEERTATIFKWLTEDLLGQYTRPTYLSDERSRAEITDMTELINADIPRTMTETGLPELLKGVGTALKRRHGSRQWPTVKLLLTALSDALHPRGRGDYTDDEVELAMIDRLAVWYKKHGDEMPSCGSVTRTDALIERGVLTPMTAWNGRFLMNKKAHDQALEDFENTGKDFFDAT